MEKFRYSTGSLILVNGENCLGLEKGEFFLCVLAGYTMTTEAVANVKGPIVNASGKSGLMQMAEMVPYDAAAFSRVKQAYKNNGEMLLVNSDNLPNRYMQPYLFQFQENVVNKKTGTICRIIKADFFTETGGIGASSRIRTNEAQRGLFFYLMQDNGGGEIKIRPSDLEKYYDLI